MKKEFKSSQSEADEPRWFGVSHWGASSPLGHTVTSNIFIDFFLTFYECRLVRHPENSVYAENEPNWSRNGQMARILPDS